MERSPRAVLTVSLYYFSPPEVNSSLRFTRVLRSSRRRIPDPRCVTLQLSSECSSLFTQHIMYIEHPVYTAYYNVRIIYRTSCLYSIL